MHSSSLIFRSKACAAMAVVLAAIAAVSVLPAEARTWTSADGKKIEAEFISATETSVTIKRGITEYTLELTKLAEADRDWVREKLKEMNAPKPLDGPYAAHINGEWAKLTWADRLPYRLYGKDLSATGKYPLIVFLHGRGSEGTDNEKQLGGPPKSFALEENYAARPCIVMVPQCYDRDLTWRGQVAEDVVDLVEDLVENLPVDPDRVYLSGYSMGGYGTWHLMGQEPDLWAAGVPIAGGGNPGDAREMKKIAIWAYHGDADNTVPVSESRTMVEAVEKARGNVKYSELPGQGHAVSMVPFKDPAFHEWLFTQKRE